MVNEIDIMLLSLTILLGDYIESESLLSILCRIVEAQAEGQHLALSVVV